MYPIRSATHQNENVGRHFFGPRINSKDQSQRDHIESREEVLRRSDFRAVRGYVVQTGKDVDESGGINQRSGVTSQSRVIEGAVEEALDLLHVRLPVDLCIWHISDNQHIQHYLQGDERYRRRRQSPRLG